MTKRHKTLSDRQLKGQFFTTNSASLLAPYADLVRGKKVIDPFAGGGDLLRWAAENGAAELGGFDLEPCEFDLCPIEQRDSILSPPDLTDCFLVTNPPYLAANKCPDKRAFEQWGQSDLYKCHLASVVESGCDEGILILPSNFISERRAKARALFFENFQLLRLDYFYYQVFPEATTGIIVLAFRREPLKEGERSFPAFIHYSPDRTEQVSANISPRWDWLWGEDFFRFTDLEPLRIQKWTGKEPLKTASENGGYLSNIVLGLLDKGAWKQGLSFNDGSPVVCGEKSFTTYQFVLPIELSELQQRKAVQVFNERLEGFRKKYHGLFLANFMGADQKILSRDFCHRLFTACLKELD
jgi:hypothetical protein